MLRNELQQHNKIKVTTFISVHLNELKTGAVDQVD